MGLSNFSAVLDFAINEEKKGAGFLKTAADKASGTEKDALTKLHSEAEKSCRALETILRENVTEMVMEPCEELDENKYSFDVSALSGIAGARLLIEKQRDFLKDASKVINLSEVRRAFDRMAGKKNGLLSEIN